MIYVLASHLFQRLWHALELLQMVFSLPHDSMAIRKVDLEVILEQICWVISVVEYCCQSKFLKIYFKKKLVFSIKANDTGISFCVDSLLRPQ